MMEYEDWRPRSVSTVDYLIACAKFADVQSEITAEEFRQNLARLTGNAGMGAIIPGLQNDPRPHRIGCNCPMCRPSDPEPRGLLNSLFGL